MVNEELIYQARLLVRRLQHAVGETESETLPHKN